MIQYTKPRLESCTTAAPWLFPCWKIWKVLHAKPNTSELCCCEFSSFAGAPACGKAAPASPVIISRLLSSRWEETTSPMIRGDQVLRVNTSVSRWKTGLGFPQVSRIRSENSLKFPARGAHGFTEPLCSPEEQDDWGALGRRRRTQVGFTHWVDTPSRVITGPTCSVGPVTGVATATTGNQFNSLFTEIDKVSFALFGLKCIDFIYYTCTRICTGLIRFKRKWSRLR